MLVAAAVCPHPPLLVPGVGAGASGELEELRAACDAAVRALAETRPDLLVVVGSAESVGPFAPEAWGSLRGFGVDVPVGSGPGEPTLPLSLTIGRWLLDRNPVPCPALLFGVTEDAEPSRCLDLGATLAERSSRVAVLAMGDGTALRTPKGPGYWDDRAEPFDTAVAAALAAGEPVYVHCWGGHGRTGTTAACYLIRHGLAPQAAIDQIIALRKPLPKNHFPFEGHQEEFVRSWRAGE